MKKFLFLPLVLFANPTGGDAVSGTVEMSPAGNTLTIEQKTDKAIVNWQDFSIQEGELTKIIQPSSTSSLLNRVVSDKLSSIYGSLEANGRVYLLNPNGILIGPKGSINTAAFLGSSLNFSNEEFLKGEYNLRGRGKITNEGKIEASKGIYLFAKEVENKGELLSKEGKTLLVGATELYFLEDGEKALVKKTAEGSLSQKRVIEAATAELKAAGGNIYSLAINQEGLISATAFQEKGGRVILQAEGGIVAHSGSITAKAQDKGGEVRLLSEEVRLEENSKIDASGTLQGGTVLIGGDYQGKNPDIPNAKKVFVAKTAEVDVSAEKGDGGRAIFWSDEATSFWGKVKGTGKNGGFCEVSSKGGLIFEGLVDLIGKEKVGKLLLDPCNIEVTGFSDVPIYSSSPYPPTSFSGTANLTAATLNSQLESSDVELTTAAPRDGGNGHITISDAISWSSTHSLTLNADYYVNIENTITSLTGTLNINAGGPIANTSTILEFPKFFS